MKYLKQISLPTIISLLRFPLTFLFLQQIVGSKPLVNLVVIYLLVIATDLTDGKLARHFNQVTKLGATLDVTADFTFILCSLSVLAITGQMPAWFIAVPCLKFTEFFFTSKVILQYQAQEKEALFYDRIGHFTALLFYSCPIIIPLLNSSLKDKLLLIIFLTSITLLASYSSLQRINLCRIYQKEQVPS